MTIYLADSQIVLWAAARVDRLSPTVLGVLEDPTQSVFCSAVSIAEFVIKERIGKLTLPEPPIELCRRLGLRMLSLTAEHSQQMAALPLLHRDPFDRLLLAQAASEDMTLITADRQMLAYPSVQILAN